MSIIEMVTIQRNVTLNSNLELLALYNVDDNSNVTQKNKNGWYDSNDQATYSTKPLAGTLWTKKFDHWEEDIPSGPTTIQVCWLLINGWTKDHKCRI